jgi:hypothetical protein
VIERGRGAVLIVALGVVVALVLADVVVGSLWRAWSPPDEPAVVRSALNVTGSRETVRDPRVDVAAMAGSPWAEGYFRELQLTPFSYWPFTESRPLSFRGEFITVDGWERRSYRAAGVGGDAPVVWLLGGSTAWGEGQRDEHTIASELVRLSEAAGGPVVVRNFGQRGWTHFQEMVLFEQLLASEEAPDVVVFYDGANEVNAQSLSVKGVPTHVQVDAYAELISGGIPEELTLVDAPPSPVALVRDAYLDRSAIRRTVGWLRSLVDPAAGAAEPGEDEPARGPDGQLSYEARTPEDARRAVEVYERGRDLSRFLAEEAGVEPLFLWQPGIVDRAEEEALAQLSAPTIDLSDALVGHEGVYIDGGHTNEEGARIVATRIWALLEPLVDPGS